MNVSMFIGVAMRMPVIRVVRVVMGLIGCVVVLMDSFLD
jgi:hypothetical protein